MDGFSVCWLAILKEANNNGVFFVKRSPNEFGTSSDFDLTVNRLEYLYKHGALIINLVEQGILNSSQSSSEILQLFNESIPKQNCKICSLSNGPGVEVVGFVYGLRKHVNALKNVSVCIATKCKQWKALSEILMNEKLHSIFAANFCDSTICVPSNFHFLPYEMTVLSSEVRQNIQYCDVLLMFKSYEFVTDINIFKTILLEILSLMKKDALLFFFDGKSRMKLFVNLAGCGKILYGPKKLQMTDIPCDASFFKLVGAKPNLQGRVRFTLWKKTVSSKEGNNDAIKNINVQKQNIGTQDANLKKGLFSSSTVSKDTTNGLVQDLNSCEALCNEHVPQTKTGLMLLKSLKAAQERNQPSFISNEESESNKSSSTSEISNLINYSKQEKLLNTNSSTNPIITHKTQKEFNSNCKENTKISKLSSIKDLNHPEETFDKSKLNAMIEHCEKVIYDLEKNLEKLSLEVHSSKNLHENCHNHSRKDVRNFYCPSHLQMSCCISHSQCCCNYSCHHFTCSKPMKSNCVRRTTVSSANNVPYLLIPLQNEPLLIHTVSSLLSRN